MHKFCVKLGLAPTQVDWIVGLKDIFFFLFSFSFSFFSIKPLNRSSLKGLEAWGLLETSYLGWFHLNLFISFLPLGAPSGPHLVSPSSYLSKYHEYHAHIIISSYGNDTLNGLDFTNGASEDINTVRYYY